MGCHSDSSFAAGDTCPHKRALLTRSRVRTDKRRLCVGAGGLALALIWATLDAFLALFAGAIHTGLVNAILDAALTRTSFVAALTCVGAIGALFAR